MVWHTRLEMDRPYQTVRTVDEYCVSLGFFPGNKKDGIGLTLNRKDARLLAKRINQCLDATVKKWGIIYFTPALIINGIFIVYNVLDSLGY